MPLVIVVVVLLIAGVIWRARNGRRLTIEQSVDRYRQTLSAVHDAAARSTATEARTGGGPPPLGSVAPARSRRTGSPGSQRRLVIAGMGAASVIVIALVIAGTGGKSKHRAGTTTTTRASKPSATTTTTRPAPTTTMPAIRPSGTSGTDFTVAKAQFTITVHTNHGICWVEMRDPSGKVLFAGTVATGQSQAITAPAVTVQLGNPAAVDVSVDGTPVPFTLAHGSPLTLHVNGTPA